MFYEEKQIKKVLNCEKCQKKYDKPLILPCGNVICNKCVNSSTNKCDFCSHDHKTIDFPICRPLLALLEQEPIDVNNTHSARTLKQNLKTIQNQLNELKFELTNTTAVLQQHFASLRNDVQICTENLIKNIHLNCDSLLNRIDETEEHYLNKLKSKSTHFYELLHRDMDEITSFHTKWSEYLENSIIDNNLIIQGNSSANFIRKILDKKRLQLNYHIFDNQSIKFKRNSAKVSENLIGSFKVKKALSLSIDELNWGTVLFEKNSL